MSIDIFTQTLRKLLKQDPFLPFFVVLTDGGQLIVDQPSVAFDGGKAAVFAAPGDLVFIEHEEVSHMGAAVPGVAS